MKGDREKRVAKGKPESKSDIEKWERNQAKFNDAKEKYEGWNRELLEELMNLYERRLAIYGPAMQEFLAVERMVGSLVSATLKDVAGLDGAVKMPEKPKEEKEKEREKSASIASASPPGSTSSTSPKSAPVPAPVSAPPPGGSEPTHRPSLGSISVLPLEGIPNIMAPIPASPTNERRQTEGYSDPFASASAPAPSTPPFTVEASSAQAPNPLILGTSKPKAVNPFDDED